MVWVITFVDGRIFFYLNGVMSSYSLAYVLKLSRFSDFYLYY